jgi:hypothetical protein
MTTSFPAYPTLQEIAQLGLRVIIEAAGRPGTRVPFLPMSSFCRLLRPFPPHFLYY